MNRNIELHVLLARHDQRGQALPLVAFLLVIISGFAGLVIDFGRVFFSYRQLQASTDAAALAGAWGLPNTTASSSATAYSSVSGNKNAYANLPGVSMVSGYPLVRCLTTLTSQGIPCIAPANANAITVKQQVSVPMTFASLFGTSSVPITATATAAMRGSAVSPYNVAIVIDTTASMNSLDADSNCNTTRINCALAGVRTLMSDLSPCGASQSTCGTATGGNVANPVDKVSLYTFPGLTAATAANDYNCSGSSPTVSAYSYPTLPTYQIVPFSSDYRSSDTAGSLSTGSNLVAAAGGKNASCTMHAVGGVGTYFAAVVYAAQAGLVAAQAGNPLSQNVLIVLSDGDANGSCSTSSAGVCTSGNMQGASTTSTTYESILNQCHQAITASSAAIAAGTRVYTVAYGATSSGCGTDTPSITPCQTMQQMASAASTFFSDYTATGGSSSCISASRSTTNLNQIFTEIAGDLTVARLIPDNLP